MKEGLKKDILYDIEMQLYMEFNDTIATMNDHLGDIYSYKDIEDTKQAEKDRKIELMEKAIKQLQNNWNELKAIVENRYNFNKLEYLEGVEKRKAKIYKQFFDKMCELENNNE